MCANVLNDNLYNTQVKDVDSVHSAFVERLTSSNFELQMSHPLLMHVRILICLYWLHETFILENSFATISSPFLETALLPFLAHFWDHKSLLTGLLFSFLFPHPKCCFFTDASIHLMLVLPNYGPHNYVPIPFPSIHLMLVFFAYLWPHNYSPFH
jgi:hypothetical protein